MISRIGGYLGLDRAGVALALQLALAAWLAFAIASVLHVQNAYWAAMPVWVVAQSQRGLLLERGFFRLLGTLAGAAVGFGLMHLAVDPYVCLALLAVWIGITAGLTHVIRGVLAYGVMMSGMTAVIVVLPSVWMIHDAQEVAIARVVCTVIGVVVVTLVTGVFTPASPRRALYERVRTLSGDAIAYVARLLADGINEPDDAMERRIVRELSKAEDSARMVSAGSLEGYRRLQHVDALVVAALSVLAAGLAMRTRLQEQGAIGIDLISRLDEIARYLRLASTDGSNVAQLILPVDTGNNTYNRLARAVNQLLEAAEVLRSSGVQEDRPVSSGGMALAPYREWSLALNTALASSLACFGASAIGLWSGWHAAELAVMGVCIFSLVLGTMPTPQNVAPSLLKGIIVGSVVATLYRFWVQPYIDTTPELVLSIAPFLLIGGFARCSRRTAMPALDANMSFLLASQAVLPAVTDSADIWGGAMALIGAAVVVAGSFILMPRLPERQALKTADAVRRDVQRLVLRPPSSSGEDWRAQAARQILRLNLHLERSRELHEPLPVGMMAMLNLGYGIVDLHELARSPNIDSEVKAKVAAALGLLAKCVGRTEHSAEQLRIMAATSGDPVLSELLDDIAAALKESSALLNFGISKKKSVNTHADI